MPSTFPSSATPAELPERSPAMRWLPWALLAAGLLVTFLIGWNVRNEQRGAEQNAFEGETRTLVRAMDNRLHAAGQFLQSAGLFVAAPGPPTAFQAYAEAQQSARPPGLRGLGFLPALTAPEGYAEKAFYGEAGLPLPDFFSDPAQRRIWERARDSGAMTMTAYSAQEFILLLPVYRAGTASSVSARQSGLIGWVYAPLSLPALVEGSFSAQEPEWQKRLHVRIRDAGAGDADASLYDSAGGAVFEAGPFAASRMDFGGQSWALDFQALPGYRASAATGIRVLAAGTLLSVILAVLQHLLLRGHHHVAEALHETTRANTGLSESRRRFRMLANSVPVLIWVSNAKGARNWFSRQWQDFTGCDPNRRESYEWSDFLHPEDRPRCLKSIALACTRGEAFSVEYRLAHVDGSYHWVLDSGNPRFDGQGEIKGYMGSGMDIDARKRAEAALSEQEALLRSIYDASNAAIFLINPDGIIVHANHRMAEIFIRPLFSIIGSEYVSLVAPEEREEARLRMQNILTGVAPPADMERRYWRPDNTLFWGLISVRPLLGNQGENHGLVGVVSDISARKRAEAGMALASRVLQACHEGIFITDAQQRIISVNTAFSKISGYSPADALGKTPAWIASERHGPHFFSTVEHALQISGHWKGEMWNRHANGGVYPAWMAISRIARPDGTAANYIAIFTDISERKKTEARMHRLAHYDYLTDLPNRALLIERISRLQSAARRYGKHFAVLFADLDLFKRVNDEYGHNVGDALLIEVGRRLKQITRASDTVSRQGGDEFVILAPELHQPLKLLEFGEKLRAAITFPYDIEGHQLTVAVSIGIAIYPRDGDSIDAILRSADAAMYRAKNSGKNRIRFATRDPANPADADTPSLHLVKNAG